MRGGVDSFTRKLIREFVVPVPYLAPFVSFEQTTFHVGGSPETVAAIGTKWVNFGQQATAAAAALRAINDGGYIGTEGEKYKELVNSQLPGHLDVTGKAHEAVGNAINKYFHALTDCLSKMGLLVTKSRGDHGMVQAAVTRYNTAELAAAAAKTKAGAAKGAAVLGSVTPMGPALAATAASAETAAAAAEAERAAAWAHYEAVKATWDGDVSQAGVLKNQLGTDVTTQVGVIDTQARKRFQENPTGLSAVWAEIKNFVSKNADVLSFIADALSIIGTILLFIPGLNIIGAVLVGVGLGLKALLAATGNGSWAEFAFELVTSLPGGALLKGAKMAFKGAKAAFKGAKAAGKGGKSLSATKSAAKNVPGKTDDLAKGSRRECAGDPIDMASGVIIDNKTDVFIDGVLPLVIGRNSNSGHELGRALGPQWVSRMDCRIEICPDEVLMLTPDGALVTFPSAPLDGSEVRADGRPWLLSFVDGAYRVRDVASGVVYVFATATEMSMVRPTGPVEDVQNLHDPDSEPEPETAGITVGGYGYRSASIAGYAGIGFEVGLSAVIHRTGHMIEYGWDQSSGLMTSMRRSDGTILELVWDRRTSRMASVWLTHEDQPDEEPVRLISYEYDAHGRLRRAINTAPGHLAYHYNEHGYLAGRTDRNGVSYTYVFDDEGRVITQAGTGGMFANALVWLDDEAPDAPVGGKVCVLVETAGEFAGDPLELGDAVIPDRLERLEALPLVKALREGGLAAAGLTGCGRDGARSEEPWQVPAEWLHDEVLGDVRPTVYRSTMAGDVWRIISPSGACEDYVHNQYHQIIYMVAPDGGNTKYEFDEDSCLISVKYADGTAETIEHASWGRPAKIVGKDGLVTEFDVDVFGNTRRVTAASGEETIYDYTYTASGVFLSAVTDVTGATTHIECDAAGRISAETDVDGRRWSVVRDYAGHVIESMDPLGNSTKIEYSPEGWPWRVTNPDGTQVRATYDGEGNVIQTINEIGATTQTQYTVNDEPSVIIDPQGAKTSIIYNTQMEVVRIVNADNRQWSFDFDLDGKVISECDYNDIVTKFQVDLSKGWAKRIDSNGGVHTTWRDCMGRIVLEQTNTGEESVWSYDDYGRLCEVVNSSARIAYLWDEWGRLSGEETRLSSGEIVNYGREFDSYGRVKDSSIEVGGCYQIIRRYGHSASGDISDINVDLNGDVIAHVSVDIDGAGRRNTISVGGLIREFDFDSRNRIIGDQLSVSRDGTVVADMSPVAGRTWSWRGDGVVTGVEDFLRGISQFSVDLNGRVTEISRNSVNNIEGLSHGSGESREEYAFSSAGVLTCIQAGGFGKEERSGLARARVQRAAAHDAEKVDIRGTLVTGVGRTKYSYDKIGRVIETVTRRTSLKPLVKKFKYFEGTGQVSEFWSSDTPDMQWLYTYDGLGRRSSKSCVDRRTDKVLSRTVFAYQGQKLVGEYCTFGERSDEVDGHFWLTDPDTGEVIGQIDIGNRGKDRSQNEVDAIFYALVSDLAGAPQELVDPSNGEVVGKASQSLFGRRQWSGTASSPLLFSGQYEDEESGWAYNRFRFYDPSAGVYGAQDPLGIEPNIASAQGYVHNPVHWIDPFGLDGCEQIKKNKEKGDAARDKLQSQFENSTTEEHFSTEVNGQKGGRFSDVRSEDIIMEQKTGKVGARKEYRTQVEKDKWIVDNVEGVREARWYGDPGLSPEKQFTKPMQRFFKKNGFQWDEGGFYKYVQPKPK